MSLVMSEYGSLLAGGVAVAADEETTFLRSGGDDDGGGISNNSIDSITTNTNTTRKTKQNVVVAVSFVAVAVLVLVLVAGGFDPAESATPDRDEVSVMGMEIITGSSSTASVVANENAQDSASSSSSSASSIASSTATTTDTEATTTTITASSPFFPVVLPWTQVIVEDVATEAAAAAGAATAANTNHYKGVMEFCGSSTTGKFAYGLPGECIPGESVAPLIRMQPQQWYALTLINTADINTNLHTHGLHVSGVGTVDDVTRVVEPGMCLTYEYYILDDADVGTYWYHPHRHPLVTQSAYGGAYGMLIVDEIVQEYYPLHIANLLTQNEVLLQFSSMYNKKIDPVRYNKVNGRTDTLHLTVRKNTYYYYRVSSVVYAESINYVEFVPPAACEVKPMAYDGVYRSNIPHPEHLSVHMMTVSSRVDLSVRCTTNATIHFHQGHGLTAVTEMVQITVVDDQDLATTTTASTTTPSNHVVLTSPVLPSSPYWDIMEDNYDDDDDNDDTLGGGSMWKPRRPYYMPDLAAAAVRVHEVWPVSMDDYYVNGTKGVSVNQHTWDPNVPIRTFALGDLIEIPIALSTSHPYHAHINRMQIVEPGGCGGRYEEGEYFDTIVQVDTDKKVCTIRTQFYDYAGRIVIHCHRFGHEDQGMMTWIDVLGGDGHGVKGAPQTDCAAVL